MFFAFFSLIAFLCSTNSQAAKEPDPSLSGCQKKDSGTKISYHSDELINPDLPPLSWHLEYWEKVQAAEVEKERRHSEVTNTQSYTPVSRENLKELFKREQRLGKDVLNTLPADADEGYETDQNSDLRSWMAQTPCRRTTAKNFLKSRHPNAKIKQDGPWIYYLTKGSTFRCLEDSKDYFIQTN